MSKKTILVTGCAGFIGSNFVRQFRARFPESEIVGIDNFSTGRRDAIHPEMILYEGSILDRQLLENIFVKHRPEFVFHFAALPRVSYSVENPVETSEANIIGTISVLDASRKSGVKRFIYSASSSAYGGAKVLPTRESENPPDPKSPYALQKYTGEIFCRMFSDLYGMDTVSLRYFNVFGPGQYGNSAYSTVISAWLESLYGFTDLMPYLEGDGFQSRDFCYVDNVVQANIKAMLYEGNFKGDFFNIGNGEQTSLREVKDLIEQMTGKKLTLVSKPPRSGDVRDTKADISKAGERFGYKPEISFRDGLGKTLDWFKSRS